MRISGERAFEIADLLFRGKVVPSEVPSHTVHYGRIVDPEKEEELDEVLLVLMRSPRTYTREDMVEICCHGGIAPVRRILETSLRAGAQLAERGEFTKRAFLNGRIDLAQAEAVVDIVRAKTDRGLGVALSQLHGCLSKKVTETRDMLIDLSSLLEAALEVPEEEIDLPIEELESLASKICSDVESLISQGRMGKMLRDGVNVPIVGRVNVGKSSLLNALLEEERAIVTPFPGTTRDTVAEWIALDGFPVRLVDTAGLRKRPGLVEASGVERTRRAIQEADLVLLVLDSSGPLTGDDLQIAEACREKRGILVLNKIDLPKKIDASPVGERLGDFPIMEVSATRKLNLIELKRILLEEITRIGPSGEEGLFVTNLRHMEALERVRSSLRRAREGMEEGRSPELIALEVREALDALGEITGETAPEEILDRVFSNFCVGK